MKNSLISPAFLQARDTVQLVAPSGRIETHVIENAKKWAEVYKLNLLLSPHILSQDGVFSGTDAERAQDLQSSLDNPNVKAILCARGGYGLSRIIDRLDFSSFISHPKWCVGFSDITVLHLRLQQEGYQSIHAVMPNSYDFGIKGEIALDTLKKSLFGDAIKYEWDSSIFNSKGVVSAQIVGGNLSVLYSQIGTSTQPNNEKKIVFIEDLNEYYYHLDRMMNSLERARFFSSIAGLLVGAFTDMKDGLYPYGKKVEEIIREHIQDLDIPLAFGFSAGHIEKNQALIFGKKVRLQVEDHKSVLDYSIEE